MATRWALGWAALGLACLTGPGLVSAQSEDLRRVTQGVVDLEGGVSLLQRDPLRQKDLRSPTHVEERLTDGELFFRLQDYERAAIILTDVVENYPSHRAAGDATYLLGESLYQAGNYMGARTRFRQVVDNSDKPGFSAHVSEALGRLIEIAVRGRDFEGVETYFAQLERLPPREVEAATNYFRGKFLYNRAVETDAMLRDDLEQADAHVDVAGLAEARQSFEAVADTSPYFAQARYFVGVILTLQKQFPAAVEAFRRVLGSPVSSPESKQVIELAQLALGRVYYESEQLPEALDAYRAVPRDSAVFDAALYELAWVYIRMGDSTRAERALEVLMVAAPDSRYQADAQILRGNLLLREGRLPEALDEFNSAVASYRPIREELDAVLESHENAMVYFRELVRQNIDAFDAASILPPDALKYAPGEVDIDRALAVLEDLNQTRSMVRETSNLMLRLSAAIAGPNQLSVFADLRQQRERTTALRNRAAALRASLIAMESSRSRGNDPELEDVRQRRRQLERGIAELPTGLEQFAARDDEMLDDFEAMNKELCDLGVSIMGLEARIAATERFLKDTGADAAQGEQAEGVAAVMAELATQRAAVVDYRERIDAFEIEVEAARAQVGVGDARDRRDAGQRAEYNQLVARERELMAAQGLRADSQVDALYQRLDAAERLLDQRDEEIESVVAERVANMNAALVEENTNVVGYRNQLAGLEEESEDVIGGVAYNAFMSVRDRFYTLVLEADVGKIDVVWAEREEHRMRVENLSRDRAREIKALDDEFREIMDQQNGGGQ